VCINFKVSLERVYAVYTLPGMTKPGRHAEIVPKDGSHYVLVDGVEWSRHDDLAKAEAVRAAIVARWAAEYERRFDALQPLVIL